MINERIALLLLNGESGKIARDSHYTREFYQCMEGFASASISVCRAQNLKKFESHLIVASKLYTDGNETVKNGIVNVFLFKVLDILDNYPGAKQVAKKCLPEQLLHEVNRQHYSSGL